MILIKNLSKTFHSDSGSFHALKNINLALKKGEIHGIVGESGAGKSSLLRCLNKLESASAGEILIDDLDVQKLNHNDLRSFRKNMGMIFQSFNLLTSKTVFQNIALPLEISGFKKIEIEKRVGDLLKLVKLEPKENSYPSQLSGGQKQRVAIARALATNPQYLLCDEPTSALDPSSTENILSLLEEINVSFGITIIIITHEMDVVKSLCHTITHLDNGEVTYAGSSYNYFVNLEKRHLREFLNKNFSKMQKESFGRIVHMQFENDSSKFPILSKIQRKLDVEFNILCGQISKIGSLPFGNLIVGLDYTSPMVDSILNELHEHGVRAEVIQ